MANIVGEAQIKISAKNAEFERKLRSAESQTRKSARKMEKSLDKVDRKSRGLVKTLGSLRGAIALVAAGVAFRQITNVAVEFENLQLTMDAVWKSADKGKTAMKWVEDWALKTPFTIQEIAKASSVLKSSGVADTIEEIEQKLTTLGDAASITQNKGETFAALVRTLSRATSNIGLEDLDILHDKTLDVYGILRRELGITRGEVTEYGRNAAGAKEITDALLRGLDDVAGGSMANASKSLGVSLSNMNIGFTKLLKSMGDGLGGGQSGMRRATRDLANEMKELFDALEPVGQFAGSVFAVGIDLATAAVQGLGTATEKTIGFLGGLLKRIDGLNDNLNGEGLPSEWAGYFKEGATDPETGEVARPLPTVLPSSNPYRRRKRTGDDRASPNWGENFYGIGGSSSTPRFNRESRDAASQESSIRNAVRGNAEELGKHYQKMMERNERLQKSFDDMGKSISSAFGDAVVDGKLSMDTLADIGKQFVSRLISEFIQLQLIAPLISSLFPGAGAAPGTGSLSAASGREFGGRVSPGIPYVVGEKRPEVFVPDSSGNILPNVGRGGGQGIVINQTLNVDGNVEGLEEKFAQLMPQLSRMAIDAVNDDRSRGGVSALVG